MNPIMLARVPEAHVDLQERLAILQSNQSSFDVASIVSCAQPKIDALDTSVDAVEEVRPRQHVVV